VQTRKRFALIRVYTKTRHISKLTKYLKSENYKFEIFTTLQKAPDTPFDLGISYCYPRKILMDELEKATFINFHPAPLPEYPGPFETTKAIKNKEMIWGVTVHYMDEEYDTGPIIKKLKIPLHEPPTNTDELGAISHYFLFKLFKDII